MRQDPGGGGINVARGLHRLGADALALYPAGGYHGALLSSLLEKEKVRTYPIDSTTNIRENWTIFVEQPPNQYRFVMPGKALDKQVWKSCLSSIGFLS
jgi:6-phosphofructokinase 2